MLPQRDKTDMTDFAFFLYLSFPPFFFYLPTEDDRCTPSRTATATATPPSQKNKKTNTQCDAFIAAPRNLDQPYAKHMPE